jgi:ribosomal protein L22
LPVLTNIQHLTSDIGFKHMRAEARYIRISPQKARLVVDLIRGSSADAARLVLRTVNKRIAPSVLKVLESAIANAKNNTNDIDVDQLVVSECYVNEGTAPEADPSSADGPRLPLSAALVAYRDPAGGKKERYGITHGTKSSSLRISAGVQ